jgi:hypothetical protein
MAVDDATGCTLSSCAREFAATARVNLEAWFGKLPERWSWSSATLSTGWRAPGTA